MCHNTIQRSLVEVRQALYKDVLLFLYNAGDIKRIPSISYTQEIRNNISSIVEECVTLSNSDWDAHETSWKYQCNELLMMNEDVMMENIDYLIEQTRMLKQILEDMRV